MLEALHAATFVVHGDDQLGCSQLTDRSGELDELQGCREVAREEDYAAHLRVLQALDVVGCQLQPGHIHHHGSESHAYPSSTTKATATPASSVSVMCEAVTPRSLR
jgi:D-serine deaminase-like pyridoxal phosphate-dependent protein